MEVQYEGPLSWRIVGDEKACRMLLKNNDAKATITNIKIHDVQPNGILFDYDKRPLIKFELLSSLPPGTELPLHHTILLEDIWDEDFWTGPGTDEWLFRLSEEYAKIKEEEAKRWEQSYWHRWKDDVLAEFLIDGSASSQHLKAGEGSGLHITRE